METLHHGSTVWSRCWRHTVGSRRLGEQHFVALGAQIEITAFLAPEPGRAVLPILSRAKGATAVVAEPAAWACHLHQRMIVPAGLARATTHEQRGQTHSPTRLHSQE